MIEIRGEKTGAAAFLGPAERSAAAAVFFLLLALYSATFDGVAASPDAEVSFQTTSALARTGALAIGGTSESDELIRLAKQAPPGAFPVRAGSPEVGRDGSYYGWFGVGQAAVGVPFYFVGRLLGAALPELEEGHAATERHGAPRSEYFAHLLVGWRSPLFGALTGMLVVLATLRLGVSRRNAFIAGLAYGVTTFAWPSSLGDLSDVQATFFAALSCFALLVMSEQSSSRTSWVFGASVGLAFLTRAALAPFVLVADLALLLLFLHRRRTAQVGGPHMGLALAPQVAALALWLWTNYARFGDALDSGYGEALSGGLFGGDPLRAALGLLVSPGRGLVWMAPGVLLIAMAWRRARTGGRHGLRSFVLGVSLSIALPALLLRGWHGAWSYGPRYLLPALPALWTLAALGIARSSVDLRPRPAFWALATLGLVVQVPGVLVDTHTYHELAVAAAREHVQVPEVGTEADREEERFQAMQFDWGFAAPWAHWRILRQRVAGLGESFPVDEVFRHKSELVLEPSQERERGYRHLAWVDLSQRLGGVVWPAVLGLVLLLGVGWVLAIRGLDPD